MKRTLSIVMLGLALLIGLEKPTRVLACSGMIPTLEQSAETAPLVVIGTLKDGSEHVITLEVEWYLKNPQPAADLIINNHTGILTGGGDCGLKLGAGHYYQDRTRMLAFLEPDTYDVGAEWRVTGLFMPESYPIIDDMLMVPNHTHSGQEQITLEETLQRVVAVAGIMEEPFGPSLVPDLQSYPAPARPGQRVPPAHDVPTAFPPPRTYPEPVQIDQGAPPASRDGILGWAASMRVAGIPVVPLVLLLIAILGFGASAWGIARNRQKTPFS